MIDWSTFTNWIITGLLGIVFGTASAWVTYRYNRERDNVKWERDRKLREEDWMREQQKLRQQWEQVAQKQQQQWVHDRELLTAQFQQRLTELHDEIIQQEKKRIRDEILKGTDNPTLWIEKWERTRQQLESYESQMIELETRRLAESRRLGEESVSNSRRAIMTLVEGSRHLNEQTQHEFERFRNLSYELERRLQELRSESVSVPPSLFWILIGVAILLLANLTAILITREWGLPLILIVFSIVLIVLSIKVVRESRER